MDTLRQRLIDEVFARLIGAAEDHIVHRLPIDAAVAQATP